MRWILLDVFSIALLLVLPEIAFADNCSNPGDCWGTAGGGAATAGGIGGLIIGLGGFWKWSRYGPRMAPRGWAYKKGYEPDPNLIGPPQRPRYETTTDQSRWVPGGAIYDEPGNYLLRTKLYPGYKWLQNRIGGEEKQSSIAASGKA